MYVRQIDDTILNCIFQVVIIHKKQGGTGISFRWPAAPRSSFLSHIIKNIHLSFWHIVFEIEELAGNEISMPVPITAVHQTFSSLSVPIKSALRTIVLIRSSAGTPVHFAYCSHFCIPCTISILICCAICARTDSSGNGISSDRSRILFVILSSYFSSDI